MVSPSYSKGEREHQRALWHLTLWKVVLPWYSTPGDICRSGPSAKLILSQGQNLCGRGLTANPCPPPHAGVVAGQWCLSFFIFSWGQNWPAAELCDFVHFGGSLLEIWLFLTWLWTSGAAFLKDDCSDEAINYKADLTMCSGLNKFASLTFPW